MSWARQTLISSLMKGSSATGVWFEHGGSFSHDRSSLFEIEDALLPLVSTLRSHGGGIASQHVLQLVEEIGDGFSG